MYIIETKRLKLRKYKLSDLDDLYKIFSDNESMKYYPSVKNIKETEDWIKWNIKNYKDYNFGLWGLLLKENNKFIGDCGITIQDIDGEIKPEIGYHINKDYCGKGYATEAAIACRDYGFEKLGFDELFVKTNIRNVSSIRVAEKLDMTFRKKYKYKNNPKEFECSYSIIK